LLHKAAGVLDTVKHTVGYGHAQGNAVLDKLTALHHATNHVTHYVLLPLCVTFYWLHEHYDALARGGGFPLSRAGVRTLVFVGLILGYGWFCHLITSVAGAGGGWMSSNNYFDQADSATDALGKAWPGFGAGMVKFVALVIVWVLLLVAALFAFVVGK